MRDLTSEFRNLERCMQFSVTIVQRKVNIPRSSVDSIEHWHDQRRIVNSQSAIKADDLKHGCDGEQDDGKNWRSVTELVSRILF